MTDGFVDISPNKDSKVLIKYLERKSPEEVKNLLLESNVKEHPEKGETCEVFYIASLEDGEAFDSNEKSTGGKPFVFETGRGVIIKGWEVALANMTIGDKVQLKISSDYAFGKNGYDKFKVPPHANLKFDLTLLNYYKKESITYARRIKEKGVAYFKDKKIINAITQFEQALDVIKKGEFDKVEDKKQLEETTETNNKENKDDKEEKDELPKYSFKKEVETLKLSLQLNLGNCYYKQEQYEKAVNILKAYIEINRNNPKAFYFKGLCNYKLCFFSTNVMENYGEAKRALMRLENLVPANEAGVVELRKCVEEIEFHIKKSKEEGKEEFTYGSAKSSVVKFGGGLYDDKESREKPRDIPEIVDSSNPKVFLDLQQGEDPSFRIEIELFKNVVPKTAENFRLLCTGENPEGLSYKGTIFSKVIKDFMMLGGDNFHQSVKGGCSVYGEKFEDENFRLNHSKGGVLSMGNYGSNTNGSEFMITFSACSWLNGNNVVFGRIISGFDKIKEFEVSVKTNKDDIPLKSIVIVDCGEIKQ